jgi:hypothetical protein
MEFERVAQKFVADGSHVFFTRSRKILFLGSFPKNFIPIRPASPRLRLAKLAGRHRLYLLYSLIEFRLLRSDAGERSLGEKLAELDRRISALTKPLAK